MTRKLGQIDLEWVGMTHVHVCAGCGTPHPGHHDDEPIGEQIPEGEVLLLRYLAQLAEDRKAINNDERLAVEALRTLGTSWAKIAHRLGMDRKTLQRQYAYLAGTEDGA